MPWFARPSVQTTTFPPRGQRPTPTARAGPRAVAPVGRSFQIFAVRAEASSAFGGDCSAKREPLWRSSGSVPFTARASNVRLRCSVRMLTAEEKGTMTMGHSGCAWRSASTCACTAVWTHWSRVTEVTRSPLGKATPPSTLVATPMEPDMSMTKTTIGSSAHRWAPSSRMDGGDNTKVLRPCESAGADLPKKPSSFAPQNLHGWGGAFMALRRRQGGSASMALRMARPCVLSFQGASPKSSSKHASSSPHKLTKASFARLKSPRS
mmetsp:Transcript_40520/g.109521  ORF Transcript_40520/g.109521 Transcript_40520/m.109521 type:complete len:265 (+) Transcript_40520:958-1752(+)